MLLSMIVTTTSCAPRHALSAPGMKPHSGPAEATGEDRQRERERERQPERSADDRGAEGPDEELPVGADVEQARTEPERDGQAGEDQGRRGIQGIGDGLRPPRAPSSMAP